MPPGELGEPVWHQVTEFPYDGRLVPAGAGLLPRAGGRLAGQHRRLRRRGAALDRRAPVVVAARADQHDRARSTPANCRPCCGGILETRDAAQPAHRRPPRGRHLRPGAGAAAARLPSWWPGPTRPAAAPAPGRWWWPRRSCRRPGAARSPGLADSKLLTPPARERVYAEVVARALAYSVVIIPADEVDAPRPARVQPGRRCAGRWRRWPPRPDYVLTDGFGGGRARRARAWRSGRATRWRPAWRRPACWPRSPGTGSWSSWTSSFPGYGFAEHKGYVTDEHRAALHEHGPCVEHRFSYVNVAAAGRRSW